MDKFLLELCMRAELARMKESFEVLPLSSEIMLSTASCIMALRRMGY
ncbi:MAG: hypothetical protein QXL22_04740 [Candidatus Nezhaarchaeales archaeon]